MSCKLRSCIFMSLPAVGWHHGYTKIPSLVVPNHGSMPHYIQNTFILTQLPLSQILKVLVASQVPPDARCRVREAGRWRWKEMEVVASLAETFYFC